MPGGIADGRSPFRLYVQQCDILLLRREPQRRDDFCERLPSSNALQRRFDEQPLHVSVGSRLHELQPPLVERDAPDGGQVSGKHAPLDLPEPDSKILRHAGVDPNRRAVGFLVGVDRHELHIHEGRLARFVEALTGHHRIVPVEDFASVCGACR